jgi:mannosyl-oligosaccharide alpha-1,2-mannosidase
MVAAFDLDGQRNATLLANARKLGDKLMYAWPAGYKTPVGSVNFNNSTPDIGDGGPNNIAAAASNILEFYKLSQYTGNKTYLQMADMTMRAIATNPKPVFPGLPPVEANKNGSGFGSIVVRLCRCRSVSRVHSQRAELEWRLRLLPEYLIKYARLTNFQDSLWQTTWLNVQRCKLIYRPSHQAIYWWPVSPHELR